MLKAKSHSLRRHAGSMGAWRISGLSREVRCRDGRI
jgi:hypothetical protein